MLATRDTILQYIPQREPMVMVHHLLDADDGGATSEFLIEDVNIFVENGFLSEAGMIENIAQTAAAQIGFACSQKGSTVPVGFIAAVKKLEISELPALNSTITTTVVLFDRVTDFVLIQGKIMQAERILCSCELRLFVKQTT